jgi:ABC-type Na+ transport system ATPase subunit NatA
MFILITTMYFIVLEKENYIRIGMMTMGLKNMPYWVSWFICSMGINILNGLVTIVFGHICRLAFFRLTDFLVLFLMFTSYGMSLIALGFLLSTLVRSAKAACKFNLIFHNLVILGFVIFAVSFILNLFLTSGRVIYLLYGDTPFPFYVLFAFYPPYNFAKIFADISLVSSKVFDSDSGSYIDGPGYILSQFTKLNVDSSKNLAPASIDSLYWLWANTAIFLAIAWYLDYVSPAGDHQKAPWFFLDPQFWGLRWCSPNRIRLHRVDPETYDEDVKAEYHLARDKNQDNVLRIVGLGKVFQSFLYYFGFGSQVIAVNDLDLTIKRGSCLGLLGHNGAGKTTTISILVGLIKAEFGDAMVNERSVKYELEQIRKSMGVCPQHDILWPDLTAAEHLRLFAEFKGMSMSDIPPEIKKRLIDVDLLAVENIEAGTFSGGMKRRLSVAIACIGDPEIILLDEPTTGMDPHSRRYIFY